MEEVLSRNSDPQILQTEKKRPNNVTFNRWPAEDGK